MRDFSRVASTLIPNRRAFHISILVISLLMIPGFISSLTPIDIESYDMETPELTAYHVLNDDFSSSEVTIGMMVVIRDPAAVSGAPEAPHTDSSGNAILDDIPEANQRIAYPGDLQGLRGEGIPVGGILNMTVLREIDLKVDTARSDPIAEFFRPLVSDLTGEGTDGILALPEQFRAFMANRSMLTRDSFDPLGNPVPARTQWYDCGEMECLTFDDQNLTQDHIDLAAHRMVNSSSGIFMRWMANDRAFLHDPTSPVIGPVGGQLGEDGSFQNAVWMPGRWSSSSTWILIQMSKADMEEKGFTFSWANARTEDGWTWDGLSLETTPPHNSASECQAAKAAGDEPCSAEWAMMALEESIRTTDQLTVSLAVGEGINVEVNRELQESLFLLVGMAIAVLVLLWVSLRRFSDVGIVGMTLGFSLLWMQGLIGWGIIIGNTFDITIISRSQFSNLLPILILALGIDDSLHALHRYKEERRNGATSREAAHTALSKVGRAIMLTTLTTMSAFLANLTSDIPALRSFGIEAALGVGAAFILTGLWAPLLRLDLDHLLAGFGRVNDEPEGQLHMVPEHWLARITSGSAFASPVIIVVVLIITGIATPIMLTLEGDFKIEDFLSEESDFAAGVEIVNTRFHDEGEPAAIVIEGDMLDPRVLDAIGETRDNMNEISENDPDRYTRTPTGVAELHAVDELVEIAISNLVADPIPFIEAGWNTSAAGNGVNCPTTMIGLPDTNDRGCLQFLYGFLYVRGVPGAGIIPNIPDSIAGLYIQPDCEINSNATHMCEDGSVPRYERMTMRWGLSQPEHFPTVELVLAELSRDMKPFADLDAGVLSERGDVNSAFSSDGEPVEYPVTWGIPTGEPVTRYVAASGMQNELQGTLLLGVFFCLITLWWGFRPSVNQTVAAWRVDKEEVALLAGYGLLAAAGLGLSLGMLYGSTWGAIAAILVFVLTMFWGERSLATALITTGPILIVVIWLYGMIAFAGYGLNMVTVAIAAMSLGVGIDYVIHVVERFREERDKGRSVHASLAVMGGASGLALVGSAVSDVTGFALISLSPMGFFASFGLFCAVMIGLSLIASMIITSAVLGSFSWREILRERKRAGGFMALQRQVEDRLSIGKRPVSESEVVISVE